MFEPGGTGAVMSPSEVIAHAVWLYFRFLLSLRMVEDILAAGGVIISHQTARPGRRRSADISPMTSGGAQPAGSVTNGT